MDRWQDEESIWGGQRPDKCAERTCWCFALQIPPLPWEKREKGERRDIDLALFMLSATGPGRRSCFLLCLHYKELLWSLAIKNTTVRLTYVCVSFWRRRRSLQCCVQFREKKRSGAQEDTVGILGLDWLTEGFVWSYSLASARWQWIWGESRSQEGQLSFPELNSHFLITTTGQ